MIVSFTPGFFYASAAFLPSTFAMYTSTLATTAFIERRGGPKTAMGIMWFGVGALLGWPFAGALIIPFVLEDLVTVIITRKWHDTFGRYVDGLIRCLAVLGVQIAIDALFYRKFTVVPWRIVMYNVFSSKGKGPDIFGTEPWHFYVRNLLLNFNLWYILAMTVAPLLLIQAFLTKNNQRSPTNQPPFQQLITLTSSFYLWFTIFTLQPHKEERFMYPAYPFLALNAAIASHILLSWFNTSNPSTILGKIPQRIKIALTLPILLASINLGLLRILGTVTAYRAPLQIYEALNNDTDLANNTSSTINLCLGKDWYRYPSSFHLPPNVRPKFIKSVFDGLLPGPFPEAISSTSSSSSSLMSRLLPPPGTYLLPDGMNDLNQADASKYTDLKHCSFLVDSEFPSLSASSSNLEAELEPNYIGLAEKGTGKGKEWELVTCEPFLDNAATKGFLARVLWVPVWKRLPERVWGRHCLLKRRGEGV